MTLAPVDCRPRVRSDRKATRQRMSSTRAVYECPKRKCEKCGQDCELVFRSADGMPAVCADCFEPRIYQA